MQTVFDREYKERNANLLFQAYACFNQHVKTDQDALEVIFKLLFHDKSGLCHFCSSNNIFRNIGSRTILCLDCKKESWFTSKTFFDGLRKVRAYLLAIWLMECGIRFSANSLAKHAKVSYDTAWIILKKLDVLIEQKFASDCSSVMSSHFRESFIKRSCETPAKRKPVCEQDEIEEQMQDERIEEEQNNLASTNSSLGDDEDANPMHEVQRQVLALLAKEKLDIDGLIERTGLSISQVSVALTMLELADLIKENFGGRFETLPQKKAKNTEKLDATSKTIIQSVNNFVRQSMHGISRRYLQFYLARFWCLTDKINWGKGQLLKACLNAERIRKSDVLMYVSPILVKVHKPGTQLVQVFPNF